MEPLSNGHVGDRNFVLYMEVVPTREVDQQTTPLNLNSESIEGCGLWKGESVIDFMQTC